MNATATPPVSTETRRQQLIRTFATFIPPGSVTELRAIDVVSPGYRTPHVVSGYFDDPEKFADAAMGITDSKGVFFVPNVVDPALLARANNRVRPAGKNPTTGDRDILRRRYFLIDVDPIRPAGISSTDEEHHIAHDVMQRLITHLQSEGWPEPIYADSGNGAHASYLIDLPADDGGLVERCLKALDQRLSTDKAKVDLTTFNPARPWKCYGTLASKGDNTPDRPHRLSEILYAPEPMECVPAELLEKLAGEVVPKPPPPPRQHEPSSNGKFDLDTFISRYLNADGPTDYKGGRKWIFKECPFNHDHTDGSAYIIELPSGAISAGCHHDGCAGKGWSDLRAMYEPKHYQGNGNGRAKADKAEPEDQHDDAAGPVLVDMADVKRVEVKWLWPGHIPIGRLTFIAGKPGEGKSFVTTDLIARVTNQSDWPDGQPNQHKGSALLIVAEDALDDTLGPRLDAAGVDQTPGRVIVLKSIKLVDKHGKHSEQVFTLRNVRDMELALQLMPDCKLVVIDPIGSFLGAGVDAHRDNEVRAVLAPVAALAEKHGVGVLIIAHTRKAFSTNADDGVLGSRAFTGLARSVWHLSHDRADRDRKLFLPGKCNLAKQPDGLAFRIDGDPPAIIWEDTPLKMHADDVLAEDDQPGPEPEARKAAEEWLMDLLKDGPVVAGDLDNPEPGTVRVEAKAADMAWRTVRRASDHLGVRKEKNAFSKVWEWRLPKVQK